MACVGEIDAGADRAREELLFLVSLLIKLIGRVETFSNITCSLGFADIYRSPAFVGADDFIRVNKAPKDLLDFLAALRIRASEAVDCLIERANHSSLPRQASSTANSEHASASLASNASCASE